MLQIKFANQDLQGGWVRAEVSDYMGRELN